MAHRPQSQESAPQRREDRRGIATVIRDVAYVSVGKYGQYLVTAVTLPLIARLLGTEGMGLLAIGMSAYFIGSLVADLGLTAFLAARVHEPQIQQLRGDYFVLRAGIVTILAVALTAAGILDVDRHVAMILFGLFAGAVAALAEDWLLIGHGRFGIELIYQGLGRLAYLGLLVVLLPRHPSAAVALACLVWSGLLPIALSWGDSLWRFGLPGKPRGVFALLRRGTPVFAARLLITGYGQGAAAVYSGVLSAASLGLYSAGDRVVRALQSMLDPIGLALLPRLARKNQEQGFWASAAAALTVCVVAAALASAGVWIAAPYLVRLVFGSEFAGTTGLLRAEALLLPAGAVSSFATTAVLSVRQDTRGVLVGAAIGTAVSGVALGITVVTRSVWTMVTGMVIAEFAVAAWYLARMWALAHQPAGNPAERAVVADTVLRKGDS